jgi:hypothetical protein
MFDLEYMISGMMTQAKGKRQILHGLIFLGLFKPNRWKTSSNNTMQIFERLVIINTEKTKLLKTV